jgi:hypothetical protein
MQVCPAGSITGCNIFFRSALPEDGEPIAQAARFRIPDIQHSHFFWLRDEKRSSETECIIANKPKKPNSLVKNKIYLFESVWQPVTLSGIFYWFKNFPQLVFSLHLHLDLCKPL